MEQTLEELLGQKTPVLFRAGHVSIRQLAERLRAAMKDASRGGKETKAVQYTFGLPFVKSLKLWGEAICRCPALRPLLQPLVIVILSAIRAKESHLVFAPYVSILIGLINDLSLKCEVFIPIASSCLTALTLCANKLASKTLTAEGREPNISDVVRVSERQLKDRRVVRGLTHQLVIELTRHSAFLARTGALPEVGWVILQSIRKVSKTSPEAKQELGKFISCLDESIAEVKEKRKPVDSLFQLGFEDTSVGRLMMKNAETQTSRAQELVEDEHENEAESGESEDEESKSVSEEETHKKRKPVDQETQEERSKRSIKRQRQKEKKRLALLASQSPEEIINQIDKKISTEAELVPFDMSDDEQ